MRALVAQGRDRTAIKRLQAAGDDVREQGFSSFAWAWLDSAQPDQGLAVAAARAAGGDSAGADKLRQAVAQGEQVETAARGLARLAIPLCPLVKEKLEGPAGEARGVAVAVLRFGLARECLPGVLVVAKDRSAPEPQRVAAVEALGTLDDPEAHTSLQALAKDAPPAIRAAALLAGPRAGAGRGAVLHLTGLLHDPAPQVRGAAAAALLRAGGEAMVPQLFQFFKEKDSRPGEAVAKELGTMKGEASAEMLGKLAHSKNDRRVRLAGARALAARRDQFAHKVQATLAGDGDAELRFLGSAVDAQKRRPLPQRPTVISGAPPTRPWPPVQDAWLPLTGPWSDSPSWIQRRGWKSWARGWLGRSRRSRSSSAGAGAREAGRVAGRPLERSTRSTRSVPRIPIRRSRNDSSSRVPLAR